MLPSLFRLNGFLPLSLLRLPLPLLPLLLFLRQTRWENRRNQLALVEKVRDHAIWILRRAAQHDINAAGGVLGPERVDDVESGCHGFGSLVPAEMGCSERDVEHAVAISEGFRRTRDEFDSCVKGVGVTFFDN